MFNNLIKNSKKIKVLIELYRVLKSKSKALEYRL